MNARELDITSVEVQCGKQKDKKVLTVYPTRVYDYYRKIIASREESMNVSI